MKSLNEEIKEIKKDKNMNEKPQEEKVEQTAYELLGGELKVRELVDLFYDRMDLDADFLVLRKLHPDNLEMSREKLFLFLSGWLGGPDLYIAQYGHPRLRARHLPFPIGTPERDQWVTCMAYALNDLGVTGALFDRLMEAFYGTADWMRNRADQS